MRVRLAGSAAFATFAVLAGAAARGQSPAELVAKLRDVREGPRAAAQLARGGPAAATALLDAWAARDPADGVHAAILASVLVELGPDVAAEVPRLLAAVPEAHEAVRPTLLRALANGIVRCDADACDAVKEVLPDWGGRGFFYSAASDAPSFAWFEYVRIRRRLALRAGGTEVAGAQSALAKLEVQRAMIRSLVGRGGEPPSLHDLNRFGDHATRPTLEAVAEVALGHAKAGREIADELAKYLAHEAPRAAEIDTERNAGAGEEPLALLPAQGFPTRWRNADWRFAAARAVLARSADAAARTHALRHLLWSPSPREREDALAAVREQPRPWTAFAPELAACLDAKEREVVRSALVTLGLAPELAAPAAERLRALAAGPDRELATLAKRVLAAQPSPR